MARRYRVITEDANGGYSIMTDWQTRTACRKFILARWGHWPPFAHISSGRGEYLARQFSL